MGKCPRWRRKSTRSVPSWQGHRRKAEKKDLILFVRICCFGALIRGLQNLECSRKGTPPQGGKNSRQGRRKDLSGLCEIACCVRWFEVCRTSELPEKGFNCCGAKLRLRCTDSRFAKPRNSLQRGRFYVLFASCKKNQKAHQRFANLWTPGTIQSSAESDFAKISGGSCRNQFCLQNAGVKALNRCEWVTVVQTQDGCFSEKKWCTASSQWVFADKMCDCSLALVRCEIEIIVCWKSFSLSDSFAWAEKVCHFRTPKVFRLQTGYEPPSKTSRFRKQNTAHSNNFLLSSKTAFSRTKNFLLHKPFLACFKNRPFLQTKSFSFAQTFFIATKSNSFPPSAFHFNVP